MAMCVLLPHSVLYAECHYHFLYTHTHTPAESPEDQWPDITSPEGVVWDTIPSGHAHNNEAKRKEEEARRLAEEEAAREREEQRRQAELERKRKEEEER